MAEVTASLIVDTHIVLWVRIAPGELTPQERAVLDNAAKRFVSVVSLWEIAILQTVGRLKRDERMLQVPPGFDLLPLGARHCAIYAALPLRHRDPFDRMLVAQACGEGVPLLTRDRAIAAYREDAGILQFPPA